MRKLEQGQSILDAVAGQAKDLKATLPARDRDRLDQYFTSVRDLEQRLASRQGVGDASRSRSRRSPAAGSTRPARAEYMEKVEADVRHGPAGLRDRLDPVVTLMLDSVNSPAIDVDGVKITDGYHNLSHHGKSRGEARAAEGHRRVAHEAARRTCSTA